MIPLRRVSRSFWKNSENVKAGLRLDDVREQLTAEPGLLRGTAGRQVEEHRVERIEVDAVAIPVMAPLRASNRPSTTEPVFTMTDVKASKVPTSASEAPPPSEWAPGVEVGWLLLGRDEAAVQPELAAAYGGQRFDCIGDPVEQLTGTGIPAKASDHRPSRLRASLREAGRSRDRTLAASAQQYRC